MITVHDEISYGNIDEIFFTDADENYSLKLALKDKVKNFIKNNFNSLSSLDASTIKYKIIHCVNMHYALRYMDIYNERAMDNLFTTEGSFITDYKTMIKEMYECLEVLINEKKVSESFFKEILGDDDIIKSNIIRSIFLDIGRIIEIKNRFPDCFINYDFNELIDFIYDEYFTKFYILITKDDNSEYVESSVSGGIRDTIVMLILKLEPISRFRERIKADKENILNYINSFINKDYIFNNIIRRKNFTVIKDFVKNL